MNDVAVVTEIPDQTTALIQVIERAAVDPNVDIDKMERLLAMQERIMETQAKRAWNDSMIGCQQVMPNIKADADNRQTNSKYAKFEDINKVIKPLYTEHGFDLTFSMGKSDIETYIRVVCDVSHTGGFSKQFFIDLPPDDTGMKGTKNKTLVHGTASTVSYAKRYLVAMIFNLTISGEDDDGNSAGGDSRIVQPVTGIPELIRASSPG